MGGTTNRATGHLSEGNAPRGPKQGPAPRDCAPPCAGGGGGGWGRGCGGHSFKSSGTAATPEAPPAVCLLVREGRYLQVIPHRMNPFHIYHVCRAPQDHSAVTPEVWQAQQRVQCHRAGKGLSGGGGRVRRFWNFLEFFGIFLEFFVCQGAVSGDGRRAAVRMRRLAPQGLVEVTNAVDWGRGFSNRSGGGGGFAIKAEAGGLNRAGGACISQPLSRGLKPSPGKSGTASLPAPFSPYALGLHKVPVGWHLQLARL